MKKGLLYIVALICFAGLFSGCTKDGTERTILSSMTANLGIVSFTASTVQPATLKPQLNDTATQLIITGLEASSGKKVILTITKFTQSQGTYSIIQGQAAADYFYNGVHDIATGGIVAIKEVRSNVVIGYFSFTTASGLAVTSGNFVVGNPWNY